MRFTSYRTTAFPTGALAKTALRQAQLARSRGPVRPEAANGSAAVGYDLVKAGEASFRLALAVPGFTDAELDIETQQNRLVVRGKPAARNEDEVVLHAGINKTGFERRFTLGEHVRVISARLADGILTLELEREVPEALRPRQIAVNQPH